MSNALTGEERPVRDHSALPTAPPLFSPPSGLGLGKLLLFVVCVGVPTASNWRLAVRLSADINTSSPIEADTRRLCDATEIARGRWVPREYEKLPYIPTQLPKKRCYGDGDKARRPWKTFEWKPAANCRFPDFSPEEFCSLNKNQTVAFIGDSLMMEQYSALVHVMGVRDFNEEDTYIANGPMEFTFQVCDNQTTLFFRRNEWFRGYSQVMAKVRPNTIVANRGAWYRPDSQVLSRLEPNLKFTQKWEGGVHFIWKTTVPGHPYCESFARPADSLDAIEMHVGNISLYDENGPFKLDYHWYDFKQQNDVVVKKIAEYLEDYGIIDAYATNILRPDEHIINEMQVDCLHNCQPGSKTLLLNQWLLHLQRIKISRGRSGT